MVRERNGKKGYDVRVWATLKESVHNGHAGLAYSVRTSENQVWLILVPVAHCSKLALFLCRMALLKYFVKMK